MTNKQEDPESLGRTPAERLKDKVAVVIGAGQSPGEGLGNGRATAIRFAREGARVLAVDRRLEYAEETANLIKDEGGLAQAFAADVTNQTELAAAISHAKNHWGSLDVLHNNVGISLEGGDAELENIDEDCFDSICQVNLRGTVFACKHAVKIMREQGGGVIINIASNAAVGRYPYVAYKASKAAVLAFTEQLALQYAPYGIRANAILPGLIATPMAVDRRMEKMQKTREEVKAERLDRIPLRRHGSAWDVANAALYLASDESAFVTGASLVVDGGQLLSRT